ncbi:MAG TPA: hypothetical protein VIJ18_18455, partial [Microbacteriaceae bacterium]
MEDVMWEATQLLDQQLLNTCLPASGAPDSNVPDSGLLDSGVTGSHLLTADLLADPYAALPPAETDPGVRIDGQVARAQYAVRQIARATAGQLVAIHATIREARDFPEAFVGPDIDRGSVRAQRDRLEFAERAAIAELATSLGISQNTVRN